MRVHDAMGRVLQVLYRINRFYMDEKEIRDDAGELLAYRKDFEGPMNVVPVSDPNIYSDTQRFAQVQTIVQRSDTHPGLYNAREVEKMLLKQLKVPDGESLLMPQPEVKEMNAVNENVAASMSRPIAAFPEQDHLAHIQVHLDFLTSPVLGGSRVAAPTAIPLLLEHLREHMVLWYVCRMVDVASEAARQPIEKLLVNASTEEKKAFDQVMAAAAQPPVEHYSFFLTSLLKTVRVNIGECAAASYNTLSLEAATKILMFSSGQETINFVQENYPDWTCINNVFSLKAAAAHRSDEIPSLKLISQNLTYATELERIV
jgi:hypothetical protein